MKKRTFSTVTVKQLLDRFKDQKVELWAWDGYFDGILKCTTTTLHIQCPNSNYHIEKSHLFKHSTDELGFFKPFTKDLVIIKHARS